jgi:hypothetical protein
LIRRQVSKIETIAATFSPACGLPTLIQFRPTAIGRIEFSAKFVLNFNSGWSKKRISFGHWPMSHAQALPNVLPSSVLRWHVRPRPLS